MFRVAPRLLVTYTAADIQAKLESSDALRPIQSIKVVDASAGCGSFFNIDVVSPVFAGKSLIQQHRIVNGVLKDEISAIHGFTLNTKSK
ncbi:BolA-like protein [Novymonas esmeraldas]|uniref:BolA-like protein n=1 Tax=Novymonas esmeraldas TaxID=1808958 RepID=A0AAW0ETL9_9TRYP